MNLVTKQTLPVAILLKGNLWIQEESVPLENNSALLTKDLILQKNIFVVELPNHVQLFSDSMDCSLQGSSVHGISQARILEWVAISFSRGFSQPRD